VAQLLEVYRASRQELLDCLGTTAKTHVTSEN
jgi:hypothetical protein